jgi:hypothetical protein
MESRKKYCLGDIEEIISEMEFEDRCDEIVEIDDDLQLLISGWYVVVPSLSLTLRAGVACVFDEEAGMFMPDFDVTVLYEVELMADNHSRIGDSVVKTSGESTQASFPADILYYEQDGFTVTLANWLNGRLPISNIETLECYLVIPDTED